APAEVAPQAGRGVRRRGEGGGRPPGEAAEGGSARAAGCGAAPPAEERLPGARRKRAQREVARPPCGSVVRAERTAPQESALGEASVQVQGATRGAALSVIGERDRERVVAEGRAQSARRRIEPLVDGGDGAAPEPAGTRVVIARVVVRDGVALREHDGQELGIAALLAQRTQRLEGEAGLAVDLVEQRRHRALVPVAAGRALVERRAHPRAGAPGHALV